MGKDRTVVLVSGGIDSTTALYRADLDSEVVLGVSFDYGSKHNACELPMAEHHCNMLGVRHEIVNLSFIDRLFSSDLLKSGGSIPDGHYADSSMRRTVVPFRNGIMLAIAAGLAESNDAGAVIIAAHSGDRAIYPDCRSAFITAMADAVCLGTYGGIQIRAPFVGMSKSDIVGMGLELGIDYARTWSCYKGGQLHCGKCGTCVERREAFLQAGADDPTVYEG